MPTRKTTHTDRSGGAQGHQPQHGAESQQVGELHSGAHRVKVGGPRHERAREAADRPTATTHRTLFSPHNKRGSGSNISHNTHSTPHTHTHTSNKQPLEPATRLIAKHHFKLIQAIHHKNNIQQAQDAEVFPQGMARRTFKMAAFIKPSSPTQATTTQIEQNTIHWMENNMNILLQHYTDTITHLLDTPGNKLAFTVATNWATRRYNHKLDPDTITETHDLLFHTSSAPYSPPSSPHSSFYSDEDFPSLNRPSDPNPSLSPLNHSFSQPVDAASGTEHLPNTTSFHRQCPQRTRTAKAPRDGCRPGEEKNIISQKNNKQNQVSQSRNSITTPTCSIADLGPVVMSDLQQNTSAPAPQTHFNRESAQAGVEMVLQPTREPEKRNKMMSLKGHKVNMTDPNTNSDFSSKSPKANVLRARIERSDSPVRGADAAIDLQPTCHRPKDNRKLRGWEFAVNKPIAILGDANISRIPQFNHPEIQADSYPGASFYHFWQILEKTSVHQDTEVLVLSVGINNRDQDPHNTSVKQLRTMIRRAHSVFPHAHIIVPVINYSPHLPMEQQHNLDIINEFITQHLTHFTALSDEAFQTTPDNIQWTTGTASGIFSHWIKQLQSLLSLTNLTQ